MENPLVTISIPTYNSSKTLEKCLLAVKDQTYENLEINIVDKISTDETLYLARKYKVDEIVNVEGSLLESRYAGAKKARGKYILILDSDQILSKTTIERAVKKAQNEDYSMLAFEETVYHKNTFVEKLFDLDRRLINSINDLSPHSGVIMPRFFETGLLLKAYKNIPKSIYKHTGGPDHAIVYYEAYKISKKVGVLKRAVKHIEPKDFYEICPKFFRWGYTSVEAHFGKYKELMNQKERFRRGLFRKGLFIESLGSICLLLLKGFWFKIGYLLGKFDRKLGIPRRF